MLPNSQPALSFLQTIVPENPKQSSQQDNDDDEDDNAAPDAAAFGTASSIFCASRRGDVRSWATFDIEDEGRGCLRSVLCGLGIVV
jgi:hypothetical protein